MQHKDSNSSYLERALVFLVLLAHMFYECRTTKAT